jgi:hypothetical protein
MAIRHLRSRSVLMGAKSVARPKCADVMSDSGMAERPGMTVAHLAGAQREEDLPRYLVAIHHADDHDPSVSEDEAMRHAIDQLNEEMIAAGVRLFAGGLHRAREAKSLEADRDGGVRVTDGPYLKTGEHMAGFWMLDVADMEAALAWGRKAVIACRAPVEVRRFH